MTYSVGFRAPSFQEIASAWFDELIQSQVPDGRYRDGSLQQQQAKAEISRHSLNRLHDLLQKFTARNPQQQERWFGRFITEPKSHLQVDPRETPLPAAAFLTEFRTQGEIVHNGWSKFAFIHGDENCDYLYVNGEEYPISKEQDGLLQTLTETRGVSYNSLQKWIEDGECLSLITTLYNHGHFIFSNEQ